MNKRILLAEDEAAIADTVVYALGREGYDVRHHLLGGALLADFAAAGADLLILDVGLPDQSGFEVCKAVRRTSTVPVVFLTARGEEIDRVVGFEIGADDYVVKPFSPRELAGRVKAILRRGTGQPAAAGIGLVHDALRARISVDGVALELTRYEYRLLAALLAEPERVFSRAQLMDRAWDEPEASFERTVDAHIKSLRQKLRAAAPGLDPIRTHRGLGYSLSWHGGPRP
ncbi:two-component system response regulator CreB [Chitinimonas koreensis]|uniref:two-component system response regulator CreB n=1 Tax=Chitinimonas koreensis TaxID=356302 RepID=UPI0003FD405C|nr:two-component system response regulator CreB [Chitinimonas koreensis]QNM97003.1 two-component system response regulator CreB [Chitinimonas koreensis]